MRVGGCKEKNSKSPPLLSFLDFFPFFSFQFFLSSPECSFGNKDGMLEEEAPPSGVFFLFFFSLSLPSLEFFHLVFEFFFSIT